MKAIEFIEMELEMPTASEKSQLYLLLDNWGRCCKGVLAQGKLIALARIRTWDPLKKRQTYKPPSSQGLQTV